MTALAAFNSLALMCCATYVSLMPSAKTLYDVCVYTITYNGRTFGYVCPFLT